MSLREHVVVDRVIDGDTVHLKDGRKIRFHGIDAPETHPRVQRMGPDAKELVDEALKKTNYAAELEVDGADRYGRVVGTLFANQKDLNLMLLESGLAWTLVQYIRTKEKADRYLAAERAAKNAKKGLWSLDDPISPSAFRRLRS